MSTEALSTEIREPLYEYLDPQQRKAVGACCRLILDTLSERDPATEAITCPHELLEISIAIAQKRWKRAESANTSCHGAIFLYTTICYHREMLLLARLILKGRLLSAGRLQKSAPEAQ